VQGLQLIVLIRKAHCPRGALLRYKRCWLGGIPFRSRQIGYNYDSAGRLSGVTATGFSATYYAWPNQYTQNLTNFASNIAYRAWGARKSMTYGNTTSEQTAYNARLQPSSYTLNNMNYQNTNVCCSYPTYSTMTWNYGYYNDGSLEHAWDTTNEWFDRAYKYDHASRLKEASTFRRARGLSPYPAISYPDPYFQSITYDAFDHSNRTGKLYTGEPSDVGTYANNRRTGWVYDADGNNTSNSSYQQTIDAAGMTTRSVSIATVGDGVEYPFQPRLDITQTYDGAGEPAKRVQISRLPGIVDQFGNPGEPIEDAQTTHYIKSTVLGGATVAELGWGDTLHIYAAGQRIAREFLGNVTFEHQNPTTGSLVTSHGHSTYRTTGREERAPGGAEMPLSNPYAYAQSYVDWKFSSPLFIEGADPFDFSGGCTSAGMPISCGDASRFIAMGLANINQIDTSGTNPRGPRIGTLMFVNVVDLEPVQLERGVWFYPSKRGLVEVPDVEPQQSIPQRKDCYAFAEDVGEIAKGIFENNLDPNTNSYPHNVRAFMDALARKFTEMSSASSIAMARASEQLNASTEYGTANFATPFKDELEGSDNQVRHAVFGLIMGYAHDGVVTTGGSWWRSGTSVTASALEIANAREDTSASGLADRALNNFTVPMGERLRQPGSELLARGLADWIMFNLCAPTK
jgi:hypothetical protein